ncbi:MAG: macrolide ABC transporter ATP-binding protein [Patescibacteria group bacterium]|nr:MAG: macrolide ABC transporter ATP-binding protein [Patescibacteria group bacterium]
MPIPVIELRNVTKTYRMGEEEFSALEDISLQIYPGEFVAIVGPSGSGKSTLMHIIGLLDEPTQGQIFIDGALIEKASQAQKARIRNHKIGFVFQAFNLLRKTSALENVAMPLIYANVPPKVRQERARRNLELVGLANKMHNHPSELSGGQQQRVAIARALINEPSLILADEPTGNLDRKSGTQIMELFRQLNTQGKTIIIVTHDPDIASQLNRQIRIVDGRINQG